MALAKIVTVTGTGVHVPGSDIDTDRIIPARFMKGLTFAPLGEFAFYDVRYDKDGKLTGHPLDDPHHKGAKLLLSGTNFGCGSSREHAPQSLYHFGLRAIIAESFAEIFFGNSTTIGLPCVCASRADIAKMSRLIGIDPHITLKLDLEQMTVSCSDEVANYGCFKVTMPESARTSLIAGTWDPVVELLENAAVVREVALRGGIWDPNAVAA